MTAWTAGDSAPDLAGVCRDGATPVDLTPAVLVTAHVRRADGTILSRPATRGAPTGSWSLMWDTPDLAVAGTYTVEVEIEWSGGKIQTFPGASFQVARQLA